TVRDFNRELADLPRRQVEYARLERTPKVLDGIYTMLQTRLKEAEISRAATDRTVRVVDPAVEPSGPAGSRRRLAALALVCAGIVAGLGLALVCEYADVALHTRSDVQLVTGLSVMGLIPHIRGSGGRVARPADRSLPRAAATARPLRVAAART